MPATEAHPARRRVRVSRAKQKVTGASVKVRLDELTAKMRDADSKIKAAQRDYELLHKEAFDAMKAARLTDHSCAQGDLKIKVSSGRSSTYIGPKEYQAAVTPEEFLESVKVSITKAKEYLSGKEINEIAVVTPGTPGKPTLQAEFFFPDGTEEDG